MINLSKRTRLESRGALWRCLVVCAAFAFGATAAAAQWSIETVDTIGAGGAPPNLDLAFDPAGNPSIAYSDFDTVEVKLAHWNGSSWDIEAVDVGGGGAGAGLGLAYDVSGRPALSYLSGEGLKFASYNGSSWDKEVVDSRAAHGDASLAFDNDGYPAIAYRRDRGRDKGLRYAQFNGTAWDLETVDAGANARYCWLAIDPQDHRPSIAYRDVVDGEFIVNFAHFDGSDWVIEEVERGDRFGIKIHLSYNPTTGIPAIVHQGRGEQPVYAVRYVQRDGSAEPWSEGEIVDIGEVWEAGAGSVAFDSNGDAWVSYNVDLQEIRVAKRLGVDSYDIEIVDTTTGSDSYDPMRVHVAIGPDDQPAVTYYHLTSPDNELKYARRSPCEETADCDDGSLCTLDTCVSGSCENEPVDCGDGDLCTTDGCDPVTLCFWDPLSCDDADDCTIDSCDSESGCSNEPDPACVCASFGDSCTENGDCCSNKCKGRPGRKTCQ